MIYLSKGGASANLDHMWIRTWNEQFPIPYTLLLTLYCVTEMISTSI